MSIKDVAFITEAGRPCAAQAGWAAGLARALGAELLGICRAPQAEPTAAECFAIGADAAATVLAEIDQRVDDAIASSRRGFAAGVALEGRSSGWRVTPAAESLASIAHGLRCFDLVIVPDDEADGRRLAELAVLLSGTPCLLLPGGPLAWKPLERIVLGWDGGREARRALGDALPFLRRAKEVRVVAVGAGALPAADMDEDWGLVAHLRRHGVAAEVRWIRDAAADAGSVLIDEATVFGADLVVIGAYGHSRAVERVFGGVTKALLQRKPAPLLIAH